MKLLIAIFATAAVVAQAGQENQGLGYSLYRPSAIYEALAVKPVALNPGFVGVSRLEKSVGGLSCIKATIVVPHAVPKYTCDINQEEQNFADIYEALSVKPVALNPGIAGASRFQKSVGGLVCEKATVIYPNAKPSYNCTMVAN